MQGPSSFLTVVANMVIVQGPDEGLFIYNGTPASGNLLATGTSTTGVDAYGNNYLTGLSVYGVQGAASLDRRFPQLLYR